MSPDTKRLSQESDVTRHASVDPVAAAMATNLNVNAGPTTILRSKKRKNEHEQPIAQTVPTAAAAPAHAHPPAATHTYPPASAAATAVTPISNEGARPNKKRRGPKASVPMSVPPELTPAESSQAEMDGLVWARIGNFASWPAQVDFHFAVVLLQCHISCSCIQFVYNTIKVLV